MGKRLLIIILIIGIIGVSGTAVLVHKGVDQMLEEQARSESLGWAEFVKSGLRDLNHILRGAPPTSQDIKTLNAAKDVGNVIWFKFYDHDSSVVWSANFREVGDENTEDYFLNKVKKGQEHVRMEHLDSKTVIAHAFLPIMDQGVFEGAIEISLDLSKAANNSHKLANYIVITVAALFLVLLLISTFFVRIEISKQRTLRKEAEQAAKARNDFVAMISHELRTPLNGILGALGLLCESNLTRGQTKLTNTAMHSTEHLLEIINDILDFTQVSAHRISFNPIQFELNELADEIDVMFQKDAFEKGLEFILINDLPSTCYGETDLKRLRQIIFNLVSNAIKFTPKGQVKLHFTIEEKDGKNYFNLNVSDTGIGLSDADQKVIFRRFRQAEDSLSRQFGGVGLGLSVCKELAELLGGTISVTSKLERGSLFSLCVPFKIVTHKNDNTTSCLVIEEDDNLKLNILLAEDNTINQKVLMAVIEGAGHTLTIAENGLEATSYANADKYDLILMDIQMPKMDGIEATQSIRNHENKNQHTPIVALSANILDEQKESYIEAGMQACLSKPIKPQDLRQAVIEYYKEFTVKT